MATPNPGNQDQSEESGTKQEPKSLEELLEEVRPPELKEEIKEAVQKATTPDTEGYPKLSRE
jgi:hypothetical protein